MGLRLSVLPMCGQVPQGHSRTHRTRHMEDEMDTYTTTELAAQHIATLHKQAATSRLVRSLRTTDAADRPKGMVRNGWLRPNPRSSQVVAT